MDGNNDSSNSLLNESDWLNAYYDPVAGINTHSKAIELTDIFGDGDYKLVAAHYGNTKNEIKLKVFKGASLLKENNLVDTPTALVSLFMDNLQPRVPGVAVASGSSIYIYKNLRPGFQFTLPPLDISGVERDIWIKAREGTIDVSAMHETLEELRRAGQTTLSDRSIMMLSLSFEDARRYVEVFKNADFKKNLTITCMSKINKSSPDEDAINCLVVGTEQKLVYIIDSEAFTILASV